MDNVHLMITFDKLQMSILEGIIAYYGHRNELLSTESHSNAYRIAKELYVSKRLGSLPLDEVEQVFTQQAGLICFYISKESSAAYDQDAAYLVTLAERFNLK